MTRIGISRLAHTFCLTLAIGFYSGQSFASDDVVFICEGDEALHWDKRVGMDSTPETYNISDAKRKVLVSKNTATIFINEDEWVRVVKQRPGYYSKKSDGTTDYTFYGGFLDRFYAFHYERRHYNEGLKTTLSIGKLEGSTFFVAKYYCD